MEGLESSTVWKYDINAVLGVGGGVNLDLPRAHNVLSVGLQRGRICAWIRLRPSDEDLVAVSFRAYGTGHDIEGDPGRFIGTVIDEVDRLVWHVFQD